MVTSEGIAWSLRHKTQTSVGEIAWDRMGDGPPVVLVHGTPSRSVLWRKVAPVLAERCCVYLYDLLGYGESERREDQDVSIAVQGRLLRELVGSWGLDRPALVGHDIGGAIVLRAHLLEGVAARRPALVDAVVLRPWVTPASRHIQAHLKAYRTIPCISFGRSSRRTCALRPTVRWTRRSSRRCSASGKASRGQALWPAHVASPPPRGRALLDGRPPR